MKSRTVACLNFFLGPGSWYCTWVLADKILFPSSLSSEYLWPSFPRATGSLTGVLKKTHLVLAHSSEICLLLLLAHVMASLSFKQNMQVWFTVMMILETALLTLYTLLKLEPVTQKHTELSTGVEKWPQGITLRGELKRQLHEEHTL